MRHGLLHLTLDVPDTDLLLDWAHTAHKPLGGHVTFFEPDQRTARETVSFAAGQCVRYQETFVAGEGNAGAYVCQLTITSDGLTLAPGDRRRHFWPRPRGAMLRRWLRVASRLFLRRLLTAKTWLTRCATY